MGDLHRLTLAETSGLIRKHQLSPVELTRALLERIGALDGQLHSFITLTPELALEQAQQAESEIMSGRYRGPLHGIPYGLKDLFYTAGLLTTGNSRAGLAHIPSFTATAAAKLSEAGGVLLGKQTAHELAHGGPSFDLPWPPARNPWNTEHFTGGSSTGSAAGVAAGFMPFALGTDTGGSIRTPASLCGLVGLKPTYGLVSRHGVIPHSFSLDHCGSLTRTVEDCAHVLQVIAGHDDGDPASARAAIPDYSAALGQHIKGLRIGVLRHLWEEDVPASDELRQATEEALAVFQHLGARLENARIHSAQAYTDVKALVCECEAFAIQRSRLQTSLQSYGADYLAQVLLALFFQAGDYVRAQRQRRVLARAMASLYEKYDLLLTTGLGSAPRLDAQHAKGAIQRWVQPSLTSIFNVTGGPALMLCSGFGPSGLPLGLQLAGRPFDESTVLKAAHAYQQATAWHKQHPLLQPQAKASHDGASPRMATVAPPEPGEKACATVQAMAEAAGLHLPEPLVRQVAASMPQALAVARRIPDHPWEEEPAGVFRL